MKILPGDLSLKSKSCKWVGTMQSQKEVERDHSKAANGTYVGTQWKYKLSTIY